MFFPHMSNPWLNVLKSISSQISNLGINGVPDCSTDETNQLITLSVFTLAFCE